MRLLPLFVSIFAGAALPVAVLRAAAPAQPAASATESGGPADTTPSSESLAVRELRSVVERERKIWDRLNAQPNDPDVQQRAKADFRDVITAYENVLRSAPEFAEAYASYGLLLSRVGEREQAVAALLKANKLNPNIPMVKNQLGNALAESGEYKKALPYYLMAAELEPNEPLYHYQLGSLLHGYAEFFVRDGLYTRAQLTRHMHTAFRRAAELAPDRWPFIYRYAESFYDLEEPDWLGALAEWERLAGKAKPGVEQQTVQLHRANVLLKLGRKDEARTLVAGVTEPALATNKQKLIDQLAVDPDK